MHSNIDTTTTTLHSKLKCRFHPTNDLQFRFACILILALLLFLNIQHSEAQRYQQVWSDEFNGTEINTDTWTHWFGTAFNNEDQFYTARDTNSFVEDGYLHLVGLRENFGGRAWTSARIRSQNAADFRYGKFQIRAKLPAARGMWPAIWMMPTESKFGGWPYSGEIDIMEFRGHEPKKASGTIHFSRVAIENGTDPLSDRAFISDEVELEEGTFSDSFHVFEIIWTDSSITWLIDGEAYNTIHRSEVEQRAEVYPFDEKFFFILNLAIGGNFLGEFQPNETTPDRNEVLIDYVRVFQDVNAAPEISIPIANGVNINPQQPFTLSANVTDSDGSIDSVSFFINGELIGTDSQTPYEQEWTPNIDDCYEYEVSAVDNDNGITRSDITEIIVGSGCTRDTFNTAPPTVPGVIQFEEYDLGGPGHSYFDSTPGKNIGGAYRPTEAVDIIADPDGENNFWVSEITTDEWMKYTINVEESGTYSFTINAIAEGGNGRIDLILDDELLVSFNRLRGSAGSLLQRTTNDLLLERGTHDLQVLAAIEGVKLDSLTTELQTVTSVDDDDKDAPLEQPRKLELRQNYPNPFNPTTRINFSLPEAGNVELEIFDYLGRHIQTLQSGFLQAGTHSVPFNASSLSSGNYYYRLKTTESSITRQMTLIK